MWRTIGDDKTRDTHLAADGQVRFVGEPFQVGDAALMEPRDPIGPPEETFNCRCTKEEYTLSDLPKALLSQIEHRLTEEQRLLARGIRVADAGGGVGEEDPEPEVLRVKIEGRTSRCEESDDADVRCHPKFSEDQVITIIMSEDFRVNTREATPEEIEKIAEDLNEIYERADSTREKTVGYIDPNTGESVIASSTNTDVLKWTEDQSVIGEATIPSGAEISYHNHLPERPKTPEALADAPPGNLDWADLIINGNTVLYNTPSNSAIIQLSLSEGYVVWKAVKGEPKKDEKSAIRLRVVKMNNVLRWFYLEAQKRLN